MLICCKESESEERLRQQVDSMQLTVTSASDVDPDISDCTEQIAALHSEVASDVSWLVQSSIYTCLCYHQSNASVYRVLILWRWVESSRERNSGELQRVLADTVLSTRSVLWAPLELEFWGRRLKEVISFLRKKCTLAASVSPLPNVKSWLHACRDQRRWVVVFEMMPHSPMIRVHDVKTTATTVIIMVYLIWQQELD